MDTKVDHTIISYLSYHTLLMHHILLFCHTSYHTITPYDPFA